jgi:hypothetical protein
MSSDIEPLNDPEQVLPPPFVVVRLFLEDGTIETGAWTGKSWWACGHDAQPCRWQTMHRRNKDFAGAKSRLTAA